MRRLIMDPSDHTILILDDEELIRESLDRLLRNNDLHAITVESAEDAFNVLRRVPVSMIISDHRMPIMSGLDFMIKVREKYPDIIRIMLTAFSEQSLMQRAINEGEIYRFFNKPWNDNELITVINKALKQKDIEIERNRQLYVQLQQSNIETVMALAEAIELKDTYTKGHCTRVRDFAIELARSVGVPNELLLHLIYGALLHDCGKIGIDETILGKPGKLTTKQIEVMKHHTVLGYELTNSVKHLKTASIFIRQHHERWDGKGYPDGIGQNQIHICSRIITIADTFDAMTSDRPYRDGLEISKAREILIQNKGSQFDPMLVDKFVYLLDKRGINGLLNRNIGQRNQNKHTLMFVDDDKRILKSLTRLFQSDGYNILTASSADQALKMLKYEHADVVVSDQNMPGMKGVEFLKIVKTKCPATARIILSGYADLDKAMAAINDAGIYKFIMKPWKDHEFRATIQNAIDWKQMSQNMNTLLH